MDISSCRTFNMSSVARINLAGGAESRKHFWQVGGAVTLGTLRCLEGTYWVKPPLLYKLEQ
jgi:hypothetical protein